MRKIKFNEPALFNNEILNIKSFFKKYFTGNGFYTKKVTSTYKTINTILHY